MAENFEGLVESTMRNIKGLMDSNTVVGEPIYTPDGMTLIPLSRVTLGYGGGGADFAQAKGYGGGTAYGVKIEPTGFLILKDGNVKLLNVLPPAHNTLDRIIDMTPDMMEKVDQMIDKITDKRSQG